MPSLLARISQAVEVHELLVLVGADLGVFSPEPDVIGYNQCVVLFVAPKETATDVDRLALWLDRFDGLRPVQRFNLLSLHGLANNFGAVIFEDQIGERVETRCNLFGEEFLAESGLAKGHGSILEKKIPLKRQIMLRLYPSLGEAEEAFIRHAVLAEAA